MLFVAPTKTSQATPYDIN